MSSRIRVGVNAYQQTDLHRFAFFFCLIERERERERNESDLVVRGETKSRST